LIDAKTVFGDDRDSGTLQTVGFRGHGHGNLTVADAAIAIRKTNPTLVCASRPGTTSGRRHMHEDEATGGTEVFVR
jgi:hypothetical protein